MRFLSNTNPLLVLITVAVFSITANLVDGFAPLASTTTRTATSKCILQSSTNAINLPGGVVKSITTPGSGDIVRLGDIATVKYSCYLPDRAPFAKSSYQKVVVGDGTMIDAWDKALRTMKIGERAIIRVSDPTLAYGSKGFPPLIPPNAVIEMDVEILDSVAASTNIDFDSLAAKADQTPRTAKDIAEAYRIRQTEKQLASASEPELEGIDWLLAKAKKFYFYGLFEGETGERPPWFLRPSITFPIAFAVVGLAFYVSLAGGAISERGAQTKDELDEIILSSNFIHSNILVATTFLTSSVLSSL